MGQSQKTLSEVIIRQIYREDPPEGAKRNPTVLSCGGIYIPHRARRNSPLYHILNTPSDTEPVKVVTGVKPRNVLYEVMQKESLN